MYRRHFAIPVIIALALGCLTACRETPQPQSKPHLIVGAASNLSNVCGEIGKAFESEEGIHIEHSFASTGDLARQVQNQAPFDIFLSADSQHIDGLVPWNIIVPNSVAVYARGQLALWTAAGSPPISKPADLLRPSVRFIAIAQPQSAPYGAAAVQSLKKLGLWEKLQPKVVYAENIAMAKQFAASGNADVAFTAYSLVIHGGGNTVLVDEKLHSPLDQKLGVVAKSPRQEVANRYAAFVLGPKGKAILSRYGYLDRSQVP